VGGVLLPTAQHQLLRRLTDGRQTYGQASL
jgi:hypothetical protein